MHLALSGSWLINLLNNPRCCPSLLLSQHFHLKLYNCQNFLIPSTMAPLILKYAPRIKPDMAHTAADCWASCSAQLPQLPLLVAETFCVFSLTAVVYPLFTPMVFVITSIQGNSTAHVELTRAALKIHFITNHKLKKV